MKTKKTIFTILVIVIGIMCATIAVAQEGVMAKNKTAESIGLEGTVFGEDTKICLKPGEVALIDMPFNINFKKDGIVSVVEGFSREPVDNVVSITNKDLVKTEPVTILWNNSSYAWLAKTGPLAGMYFPKDSTSDSKGQTYAFPGELPDYFEFNAKVWYGEKIQRLGIVSAYKSEEGKVYFDFRFDQAENQKKERFPIVNVAGQQVYFRIGDKEILLNPPGRSKPVQVYPGWYYLEESHKQKTTVFENNQWIEKDEVVTGDILIGVAFHQREVRITPNQLTTKISASISLSPPEPEKKGDLQASPKKPAVPIRRK
jgi:hypothetical protein